jgi:hypothetical protein
MTTVIRNHITRKIGQSVTGRHEQDFCAQQMLKNGMSCLELLPLPIKEVIVVE